MISTETKNLSRCLRLYTGKLLCLIALLLVFCRRQDDSVGHGGVLGALAVRVGARQHRPQLNPRSYYLGEYGARCLSTGSAVSAAGEAQSQRSRRSQWKGIPCYAGHGVRVAVLDTGLCAGIIEASHNRITCESVVPGVACVDTGCRHGTRSVSVLAGHLIAEPQSIATIDRKGHRRVTHKSSGNRPGPPRAQTYVGIAPEAEVRVLRIFDRQLRTQGSFVIRALDLLLQQAEKVAWSRSHAEQYPHAARPNMSISVLSSTNYSDMPDGIVDVVSLSYGSEDYFGSPAVQDRLSRLMNEFGVIVVAAAGNDGVRFGSVRSPADLPGVVAVGAMRLEWNETLARTAASCIPYPLPGAIHQGHRCSSKEMIKSVAHFSGRGPTTRELPIGAGRVKPDLIALGQGVLTVQGVSRPHYPLLSHSSRRSSASDLTLLFPALDQRTVSGTSIAAPIVAGVVALCVEATRAALNVETTAFSLEPLPVSPAMYIQNRRDVSVRVRGLLLKTAVPLEPPVSSFQLSKVLPRRRHSTNSTLAGEPSMRLYAHYLHLSRYSIFAQGAGEVQPLRALRAISDARDAELLSLSNREGTARCVSFAQPSSVRVADSSLGVSGAGAAAVSPSAPLAAPPLGDDTGWRVSASGVSTYWWPLSDRVIFPGSMPVLFNLSINLCPPPTTSRRPTISAAYVQYEPFKITGFLRNKPKGPPPQQTSNSSDSSANSVLLLDLNPTSWKAHGGVMDGLDTKCRRSQEGCFSSLSHPSQRFISFHLLRAATELTEAWAGPDRGVRSAQPMALRLPPIHYSLSIAFSVPVSTDVHLCYNDVSNSLFSMKRSSLGVGGSMARTCLEAFHVFRALDVEGVFQVFRQGMAVSALKIPFAVRVTAPPPRAVRILLDTSLDWFNPTAAASDIFIAGDAPHEGAAERISDDIGAQRRLYDGRVDGAYAESTSGDHPYTNLALLWLYLQYTLGMTVESFPLLHLSSTRSMSKASSSLPHSSEHMSAAMATEAFSRVGSLMVVDPERPLSPDMRKLLTAAVLGISRNRNHPGLNVVLITDWYDVDVAAHLAWKRDTTGWDFGGSRHGAKDAFAAALRHPGGHSSTSECSVTNGLINTSHSLRAWIPSASEGTRGLAGSCHVPSWNQWLSELTSVATASPLPSPFALSESIVVDGEVMVRDASASDDSRHLLRSLGRLKAAGALQWRSTVAAPPWPPDFANATPRGLRRESREAFLCNAVPSSARLQRRLMKRRHADLGQDGNAIVADEWVELPYGGEVSATSRKRHQATLLNNASSISRISHGFVGFLSLPRATALRSSAVEGSSSAASWAGRVAIFTDSDCLSISDAHVEAALTELEYLLYPTFTSYPLRPSPACYDWDCLAQSPDGQRLLRTESARSTLCVEVVKELLSGVVLEGGPRRWMERRIGMDCEGRSLASFHAEATVDKKKYGIRAVGAEGLWDVGDAAGKKEFADLLDTAPERARVGEVVQRLWVDVNSGAPHPTSSFSYLSGDGSVCRADPNGSTSIGFEDIGRHGERLLWRRSVMAERVVAAFDHDQKVALTNLRQALSMRYHNDWGLYQQGNTRSATTLAGPGPSEPLFSPGKGAREGMYSIGRLPTPEPPSLLESLLPLADIREVWGWVRHPIVLFQLAVCGVLFLVVQLERVWRWWHRLP